MTASVIGSHVVEDGDPKIHEAFCLCGRWRLAHESRNKRIAGGHRHLADAIDPPSSWSQEELVTEITRLGDILHSIRTAGANEVAV